jgi:hypothetical protein
MASKDSVCHWRRVSMAHLRESVREDVMIADGQNCFAAFGHEGPPAPA